MYGKNDKAAVRNPPVPSLILRSHCNLLTCLTYTLALDCSSVEPHRKLHNFAMASEITRDSCALPDFRGHTFTVCTARAAIRSR